ncbi:MAG: tetratricopeptide repeat protein [Anaeromicrobium sp.]|uniref:tetratricopeptide repeat protein n=1 Tax=Anaeromicrobium sp. TaxID=1929132 RepID=UPI0025D215D1|nr:tetratricopeptide repeat protein [Anaeromicrobium sp.]MCT4594257.1 tetratricopeptide repeat protein [Anaeromicrobium sp.]
MKGFILYFIIRMFTGSPIMALISVVIIYGLADKFYFGFLPDFTKSFRRNSRIKKNLKALELNPQNAQAALSLGLSYVEKKKYEEAIKYLKHHKLQDNETPNYLYNLGISLMEIGESTEGKEYIIRALDLNPSVGYGLSYIYLLDSEMKSKSSDLDKMNDLEEKIERFSNTQNLYKMGMIYKKLGNKHKAKRLFSKAIKEYSYCPKGIRRIHRKWAILSRIRKIT